MEPGGAPATGGAPRGSGGDAGGPPVVYFVHVMKAAGNTVADLLTDWFGPETVWPHGVESGVNRIVRGHWDPLELVRGTPERLDGVRVVRGHHPLAGVELAASVFERDVLPVTVLRDPVERTISLLRDCRILHPEHRDATLEEIYDDEFIRRRLVLDHQTKVFSMAPEELVDPPAVEIPEAAAMHPVAEDVALLSLVTDDTDEVMSAVRARYDEDDVDGRFLISQFNGPLCWDIPSSAERLETAMEELESVPLLGVAERLDEFVVQLADAFGAEPPATLPRRNPAGSPDDSSESLRRRIAAENARDVALYQHALEVLERRAA